MDQTKVGLLREVVNYALNSEQWNQAEYCHRTECDTFMCIAGFAAITFAGWVPVFRSNLDIEDSTVWVTKDNETKDIDQVATEYLGLTRSEAEHLFAGNNTAEDITHIVDSIINGEYSYE